MSISSGNGAATGYKLVVFDSVGAAAAWVGAGVTRPLALLVRLGTGRLIEIDLGLNDEGIEISEGDRARLPIPGSALIVTDAALGELQETLRGWDPTVHTLGSQNHHQE